MHISELAWFPPPGLPWRQQLMRASFRGAYFHTETGTKENARRIVTHEFPKKEFPYSEDMGRRAMEFSVRGYCITYVHTEDTLFNLDYRVTRDLLLEVLEKEGYGVLQLPTLPPYIVVCPRYRLTEEMKLGGYCTFDMTFVEFGLPPTDQPVSARDALLQAQEEARRQAEEESKKASEAAGAGGITFPEDKSSKNRRLRSLPRNYPKTAMIPQSKKLLLPHG